MIHRCIQHSTPPSDRPLHPATHLSEAAFASAVLRGARGAATSWAGWAALSIPLADTSTARCIHTLAYPPPSSLRRGERNSPLSTAERHPDRPSACVSPHTVLASWSGTACTSAAGGGGGPARPSRESPPPGRREGRKGKSPWRGGAAPPAVETAITQEGRGCKPRCRTPEQADASHRADLRLCMHAACYARSGRAQLCRGALVPDLVLLAPTTAVEGRRVQPRWVHASIASDFGGGHDSLPHAFLSVPSTRQ